MLITGSRPELEEKAAAVTAATINKLLEKKRHAVLAVCGGTSVEGIYRHLAEKDIDWKHVHLFLTDERLVPLDDVRSNYSLVLRHLSGVARRGNIHPFIFDPENPENGARHYAAEIEHYGGVFDLILVSSGEDGHIASLYPCHHSITDSSGPFITMNDAPKPPRDRMSSSAGLLLQSGTGIILFFGESKKEALSRFLDDSSTMRQAPAKLVSLLPEYFVFTDQEVGNRDAT
jgi:6-phosphogluconolactonase